MVIRYFIIRIIYNNSKIIIIRILALYLLYNKLSTCLRE
jgi:hypothetical protein